MNKSEKVDRVSFVSRMRKAVIGFIFKDYLHEIKEEFSDHLETINDNTNEIQANYEYLCDIESKIQKSNERMDELTMLMRQRDNIESEIPIYDVAPLTKKEKEVFFALYTVEEEKGSATYHDIAKKVMMPVSLVQAYITNLIEKGIPVMKRYVNNAANLNLDSHFRALQTKENIVGISEMITENMVRI